MKNKLLLLINWSIFIFVIFFIASLFNGAESYNDFKNSSTKSVNQKEYVEVIENNTEATYRIVEVIDGDTVEIDFSGENEKVRLIGIDAPETVDPGSPVECFGPEASSEAKSILSGISVLLEFDDSQGIHDKYGRLLAYVFLADGTNVNEYLVKNGYAVEYTYNAPYKYQLNFKNAQKYAKENGLGLWAQEACGEVEGEIAELVSQEPALNQSDFASLNENCFVKANISTSGEKIFHVPGCQSYDKTVIDLSAGERWFCSEGEALNGGWRKALNCY